METGDVIYIEANSGAVKVKEKFCTFMQVYVSCRPFSAFVRRLSDLLTLTDMKWFMEILKRAQCCPYLERKVSFAPKERGDPVHN